MRRYGTTTPGVTVPGRDAGLNLRLRPLAATQETEPEPCVPDVAGLFWFSEARGAFDSAVEAAYLLPDGAAGPVLAVAGLLGETCGAPVIWTTAWVPEAEGGAPPVTYEDGARLIVYPLADTAPGLLEVAATHEGREYDPILLSVLRYECALYGYAYCPPCAELQIDALWWENDDGALFQGAAGPWAHVVSLRGQWPSGTLFSWNMVWSGPLGETPTYLVAGPALGVFRPAAHSATGTLSVNVAVTPPVGDTVQSPTAVMFVS